MCKGEKWDRNQVKSTFLIELDIVKHLSNQNRRELFIINDSVRTLMKIDLFFYRTWYSTEEYQTILALFLSDRMCLVPILRYSEFF